jgi:hypothetical protein
METPNNQTLFVILTTIKEKVESIDKKVDDNYGMVARNKKYIDRIIGGFVFASFIVVPVVVWAIENLLS